MLGEQRWAVLAGSGREMAVKRDSRRTATVPALDHCTTRFLPQADFDRFLLEQEVHAEFADYLVAKLSETVAYQIHRRRPPGPLTRWVHNFARIVRSPG